MVVKENPFPINQEDRQKSALSLLQNIEMLGGEVYLEGDKMTLKGLPKDEQDVVLPALRELRPEIMFLVRGKQALDGHRFTQDGFSPQRDSGVLPKEENPAESNLEPSRPSRETYLDHLAILYNGIAHGSRKGLSLEVPKVSPLHVQSFMREAREGHDLSAFSEGVALASLVAEFKHIFSQFKRDYPDDDTYIMEAAIRLCAIHKDAPDPYQYLRDQGIDPDEMLSVRHERSVQVIEGEVVYGEGTEVDE